MENNTLLDEINKEENSNQTISKDEDTPQGDAVAMQMAETLILELPATHKGRNHWLSRYGQSDHAKALRTKS